MKKTEKSVAVMPKQFIDLTNQHGIETGRATKYATPYVPLLAQVNEFEKEVKKLDPTNPDHAARAKRIALDLGKLCSQATEIKKADKVAILSLGRYLDGLYNTVEGAARLTQSEAKEIAEHQERIEAAKKEQLRLERLEKLAQFEAVEPMALAEMPDEVFNNYLKGCEVAYNQRIEAERLAEEARQESIRLDAQERKRQLEIAPLGQYLETSPNLREMNDVSYEALLSELRGKKATYEAKQEEIRIENERLRKEREEKQREIEAAQEKARKEAAELEAKRQAELKAERDAKEKLEREIREKQEAEEKARKAKELEAKKAASAPDKIKLQSLANSFNSVELPDLKSDEAKQIIKDIEILKNKLVRFINEKAGTL